MKPKTIDALKWIVGVLDKHSQVRGVIYSLSQPLQLRVVFAVADAGL